MINGNTVYCDCCGSEKLAEIHGGKLVIRDRRHGQKHVAVIPIRELLDKLGTNVYGEGNEAETLKTK